MSGSGDRHSQGQPERRSEVRYDGGVLASFTHTPREGGVRAVHCTVVSLSAAGMVISAPVHGALGEHLWVELDGFGLVRCEIDALREDGFVCLNLLTDDARNRLGNWVAWLRRHGGRVSGDNREFMRTRPRDAQAAITFADGETANVRLGDISRAGAAVMTSREVTPGDAVSIGRVPAHVVRLFDGGFAVAFDLVLDAADADRLVAGYEVTLNPKNEAI